MNRDQRILQLLESMLDSDSTPDQVCLDCPELLPAVTERWKRLREVEAEVEAIFPAGQLLLANGSISPLLLSGEAPAISGYQISGILGRGGMGVVYRARHLNLDRPVALKMLLWGAYASPSERARFAREAKLIAGLRNPNLVQVYDVGEFEGCPYFTMELVEGGSLAGLLNGVPQPPSRAADMIATLALAMRTAHEGGIVHRDLKPSNILLASDNMPKISDFGLARRFDITADVTRSGDCVGTPSYMAPEQVTNRSGEVGPAADIYSLGAILYEMLTGRPPFRADTVADTERQLIADEPARPSRLNAKIPRDLETICLKCLQKDPKRRYASTAALADDLRRFLNGEPIKARPVGVVGRTVKWVRRRPAQAISLVVTFILIVGSSSAAVWFLSASSARAHAVEADIQRVIELDHQGKWDDARTELLRAEIELGNHGPSELHQQLEACNRELDLVAQLDYIRMNVPYGIGNSRDYDVRDAYQAAFQKIGVEAYTADKASAVTRITRSPIRKALVVALDDWAVWTTDVNRRKWLLELAQASEENPTEWRGQFHDIRNWKDGEALGRLAASAPIAEESVSTLVEVGRSLKDEDAESGLAFLTKVQQQHPNDFWANLSLGDAEWAAGNMPDAARYFQVAVALQPNSLAAEHNLGAALFKLGHNDEAIVHLEDAVRVSPTERVCRMTLALALSAGGKDDRAIQMARSGLPMGPDDPYPHVVLGRCLEVAGHQDEAMAEYHRALCLAPNLMTTIPAYKSRPNLLYDGPVEQRFAYWKVYIRTNPTDYASWYGYGELCLLLGDENEYRTARTKMLALFSNTTDPRVAEHIGRSCLLLPGSADETRKADTLVEKANSADVSKVGGGTIECFRIARELAEYRQGHLDEAIRIANTKSSLMLRPMPQLILAMAEYRSGNANKARATLDSALKMYDWNQEDRSNPDGWMFRVLRREAEAMIPPAATQPAK